MSYYFTPDNYEPWHFADLHHAYMSVDLIILSVMSAVLRQNIFFYAFVIKITGVLSRLYKLLGDSKTIGESI